MELAKVYNMIEYILEDNDENIAAYLPLRNELYIHNKEKFAKEYQKAYMKLYTKSLNN